MALTMPMIKVQLALAGTVWNGSCWATIAPFVCSFGGLAGRQHQTQRCEPGQLTLEIDNSDGRFNPWTTTGPYSNRLSATDSGCTTGLGTWTGTAATLATQSAYALYGTQALELTTTASSGTAAAETSHSAYPVIPGRTYTGVISALVTTTHGKTAALELCWYSASGTLLSTSTGQSIDPGSTRVWYEYTVVATAPATAAYAQLRWAVTSGATGQVYYLDCAGLYDLTCTRMVVPLVWSPGGRRALNPAQPIKVTATWEGTTYPVFTGSVDDWTPKYGYVLGKQAVVAHDYLHQLALAPASPSDYVVLVLDSDPLVYWRLGTPAGAAAALDSSGNGHDGTLSGGIIWGEPGSLKGTAGTAVQLGSTASVDGQISADFATTVGNWTAECIFLNGTGVFGEIIRGLASGPSSVYVQLYLSTLKLWYQNSSGALVSATIASTVSAGAHHLVVRRATAGTVWVHLDGVLKVGITGATKSGTTATATPCLGKGSGTTAPGGIVVQEAAWYTSLLTTATITAHYTAFRTGIGSQKSGQIIRAMLASAGVPSSAIGTIATGTVSCKAPIVTLGQTQLLSTVQTIENTEQGLLYCKPTGKITYLSRAQVQESTATSVSRATFADDLTPGHYRYASCPVPSCDDQTLFNFVAVGIQGSTTAETSGTYFASTPSSIKQSGSRVLTGYTGLYFATPATAQALAAWLLSLYAEPKTRVRSLVVDSVTDDGANIPQMLERGLLDAVTVRWQPVDGSASPFVQEANIEQIKHVVTPEKWTTTWALSAVVRPTGPAIKRGFQVAIAETYTAGTTLTLTVHTVLGTAAGATLLIACFGFGGAHPISATDSRGNTYTIDATGTTSHTAAVIRSDLATHSLIYGDTITITYSASATHRGAVAYEYSNIAKTSPLVGSKVVHASPGSSVVVTPITPDGVAGCLFFSAWAQNGGAHPPAVSTPFTQFVAHEVSTDTEFAAADVVRSSTAPLGITWTSAGTTNATACLCVYAPA